MGTKHHRIASNRRPTGRIISRGCFLLHSFQPSFNLSTRRYPELASPRLSAPLPPLRFSHQAKGRLASRPRLLGASTWLLRRLCPPPGAQILVGREESCSAAGASSSSAFFRRALKKRSLLLELRRSSSASGARLSSSQRFGLRSRGFCSGFTETARTRAKVESTRLAGLLRLPPIDLQGLGILLHSASSRLPFWQHLSVEPSRPTTSIHGPMVDPSWRGFH